MELGLICLMFTVHNFTFFWQLLMTILGFNSHLCIYVFKLFKIRSSLTSNISECIFFLKKNKLLS